MHTWRLYHMEDVGIPHQYLVGYSSDVEFYYYANLASDEYPMEDAVMFYAGVALAELGEYTPQFDEGCIPQKYMACDASSDAFSYWISLKTQEEMGMFRYAYWLAEQGEYSDAQKFDTQDSSVYTDEVNPDYYRWHAIECKDVTNHFNFNLGCAIKYIWRSGGPVTKGTEVKDLQKAIRYLQFEIERLENEQSES